MRISVTISACIILLCFYFALPKPLFETPCSTILLDRNGLLLQAKIADDQQWRFPEIEQIPAKYKESVLLFEDQHYYKHIGVNPISLFNALVKNIKARRVISGGSTISMQVIRLSRNNKSRTILEKIIEIILAFRLEISYSKLEILKLYASHAPFGVNVVGLDAASWRYFGRSPQNLSWAESATLAVLPNAPRLIYPGRNIQALINKRNRLLKRLFQSKRIDETEYELALMEPLPMKPSPLPQLAPHLMVRVLNDNLKEHSIKTTLDRTLQLRVNAILNYHHEYLKENKINNAAALVLDVETGNTLAYIGNVGDAHSKNFGSDVDVISSPRSTGSILKPFLYASMLQDGLIAPGTLIPDIPTQIAGYTPKNYNEGYDGAVPAKRAISRSLNIPAVRMLQEYGVERFYSKLKALGLTTLHFPSSHYGLSLILGGAEATLWDLAGVYASMSRTLNHYALNSGRYNLKDFHQATYTGVQNLKKETKFFSDESSVLNASPIWQAFEAMVEVSRPDEESSWTEFSSLGKVAWKTGTSFGSRDGWAIGCTPKYVVAVWVGNASGEGRSGLTGIGTAGPILFDIFRILKTENWFEIPYGEMAQVPICRSSGQRASELCEPVDSIWTPNMCLKTPSCQHHKLIHLDKTQTWQVNDQCASVNEMVHKSWFVLPPIQEWYYKFKNPEYSVLPPFKPGCGVESGRKVMDLIYPRNNIKIIIPREIDGQRGRTVFEATHRDPNATVYWHLNDQYVGSTKRLHQLPLERPPGKYILTLMDNNGESINCQFEILK